MEKIKTGRRLLIGSCIGYFICAASTLLLPWAVGSDSRLSVFGFATGILFWIGLLAGTVLFIVSWLKVRSEAGYKKKSEQRRLGCISFFRSKVAAVADIICILMIIATIVGNFVTAFPYLVNVIIMFLLIFTLCLHCIFNGKVYRYLYEK